METDIRYKQGRKKGIEEGLEKGLEKGIEKGMEKGQLKAKKAFVENLLAQGNFTMEQIQKLAGVSAMVIEEVKNEMEQSQPTTKPRKGQTKNGKKP